jgi:hypothetical protein
MKSQSLLVFYFGNISFLFRNKYFYKKQQGAMNNCQAKRTQEAITFSLLPFHSSALGEIKDNRQGLLVSHPQIVASAIANRVSRLSTIL